MADVYVNALTTISTEPTTTDSIVAVNRNTNEGKIIDYNLLADVILNKIASKQFSGLTTTSKLLTGAINELDSDIASQAAEISSLNSSLVWKILVNITVAANQALDQVITFDNNLENYQEIMFCIIRASNARTFATSQMPIGQFLNGAIYASGIFAIYAGAMNANPNNYISAVAIYRSPTSIEVALNAVSEALIVRVFVR